MTHAATYRWRRYGPGELELLAPDGSLAGEVWRYRGGWRGLIYAPGVLMRSTGWFPRLRDAKTACEAAARREEKPERRR